MIRILVWAFIIVVVIGVMFYYRKKKDASILKTFFMGCAAFIATFVFLFVMFLIFNTDEETSTSDGDEVVNYIDNRLGLWTIEEYVNDFKEPTGQKFIFQESTKGSFSNSATTNSELIAQILIDNDDIRIQLKRYGSSYAKDEEYIAFQVKRDNEIIDLGSNNYINNQGYINVGKTSSSPLIDLLMKGGEVKFFGSMKNGRSTYNFSFNGDKLKEALAEIGVFYDSKEGSKTK